MKKKGFILLFCSLLGCSTAKLQFETLPNFSIERYMGKWYEIARTKNRFQKNMVNVTANYRLLKDGNVEVINSGYSTTKKRRKEADAIAYPTDIPNLLRVSFFRPFKANYWVVYVDSAYTTALVCGGKKDMFWILARTPELPEQKLNHILDVAQLQGLDVSKLLYTYDPSMDTAP